MYVYKLMHTETSSDTCNHSLVPTPEHTHETTCQTHALYYIAFIHGIYRQAWSFLGSIGRDCTAANTSGPDKQR